MADQERWVGFSLPDTFWEADMPEVERPKIVECWGSTDGICQMHKALGSAPARSTHENLQGPWNHMAALLIGLLVGMGTGLALEGRTQIKG